MKQFYKEFNFRQSSLALLATIDRIVEEYVADGYRLTVRQLYYQLVARDVIPNTERSYKNTVELLNNGRLAGLVDWDAIEDRTRSFSSRPHWTSGSEIIRSAAHGFHMDMWANQDTRVFCIIEKEALIGVVERICHRYDVPVLAARGYPSASVLREFVERDFITDQHIVILHLGDHDPSGIDMTRDLQDRIDTFRGRKGTSFELIRIALTMDQINEQKPPPNPAKTTDSRFVDYQKLYGNESWELDALQPTFLNSLIETHVDAYRDLHAWISATAKINRIKQKLNTIADKFRDED